MGIQRVFAFFCFTLALCQATSAAAADVVITDQARTHFRAGVAYLEDPQGAKYDEAYREFHLAYAESPSYKILNNIGYCALNLERDGEAIESYEAFLAQALPADIPPSKRRLMERDIAMLKASLVHLNLTTIPTTVSLTDERQTSTGTIVVNRYKSTAGRLAIGIHPGHHRLIATADGFVTQEWVFEADAASQQTHTFQLRPVNNPTSEASGPHAQLRVERQLTTSPLPPLVYTGVVATSALTGVAIASALLGNSKHSKYENLNAQGTEVDAARDARSDAKLFYLVSDVSLGAAALAAAGTVYVYFTRTKTELKPSPHRAYVRRVWLSPEAASSGARLSAGMSF